jgi:hypothetical protein
MPTLEEIMRAGSMPGTVYNPQTGAPQQPPVSNRQKWADSLSDIGLAFLASGSQSFGQPLARGIQMKRDRKQQAKDEARTEANEQFKRGLGIADLDMQTKRYDAKIAKAQRPQWKSHRRYNSETGQEEYILMDQFGNMKPFGGQKRDKKTGSIPAGWEVGEDGKLRMMDGYTGSPNRGTSAMQNFAERKSLVEQFGEDSEQVVLFDRLSQGGNRPGNREDINANAIYKSAVSAALDMGDSPEGAHEKGVTQARLYNKDFMPGYNAPEPEPVVEETGIIDSINNALFGSEDDSDAPASTQQPSPQPTPQPAMSTAKRAQVMSAIGDMQNEGASDEEIAAMLRDAGLEPNDYMPGRR